MGNIWATFFDPFRAACILSAFFNSLRHIFTPPCTFLSKENVALKIQNAELRQRLDARGVDEGEEQSDDEAENSDNDEVRNCTTSTKSWVQDEAFRKSVCVCVCMWRGGGEDGMNSGKDVRRLFSGDPLFGFSLGSLPVSHLSFHLPILH